MVTLRIRKRDYMKCPVTVLSNYMSTVFFHLSPPVNVSLAKCADFPKITWHMALDPGWDNDIKI